MLTWSLTTLIGSIQVCTLGPGKLEMSGCRILARQSLGMCGENAGRVSGDDVSAGGEVHAQRVDGVGDNKADECRDRSHRGSSTTTQ